MRHIKLYEEYEDLLSDLNDIGAHGIDFDFWFTDTSSMDGKAKVEENYIKNWKSKSDSRVFVTGVEGVESENDTEWATITLSNGTIIEYFSGKDEKTGEFKESFKINGKEYIREISKYHESLPPGYGDFEWILNKYDTMVKKGL